MSEATRPTQEREAREAAERRAAEEAARQEAARQQAIREQQERAAEQARRDEAQERAADAITREMHEKIKEHGRSALADPELATRLAQSYERTLHKEGVKLSEVELTRDGVRGWMDKYVEEVKKDERYVVRTEIEGIQERRTLDRLEGKQERSTEHDRGWGFGR